MRRHEFRPAPGVLHSRLRKHKNGDRHEPDGGDADGQRRRHETEALVEGVDENHLTRQGPDQRYGGKPGKQAEIEAAQERSEPHEGSRHHQPGEAEGGGCAMQQAAPVIAARLARALLSAHRP